MESALLPLLAVGAGLLSFASPCALPLIPSYLSYVSGLPVSELDQRKARGVALRSSLGFVAGFAFVFTLLGASSSFLGSLLVHNLPITIRVAGIIIIVIGMESMGLLQIHVLDQERRLDLARMPRGPRGSIPLGMAFAFGWVPCIGPLLATILAVASTKGTLAWGAILLALYSLGLGIPFVLLALGFSNVRRSLVWLRRNGRTIQLAGGFLLICIGVLFVIGAWQRLFVPLQSQFAKLEW